MAELAASQTFDNMSNDVDCASQSSRHQHEANSQPKEATNAFEFILTFKHANILQFCLNTPLPPGVWSTCVVSTGTRGARFGSSTENGRGWREGLYPHLEGKRRRWASYDLRKCGPVTGDLRGRADGSSVGQCGKGRSSSCGASGPG